MSDTSTSIRNRALSGNLLCMASMMVWAAGFPAADMLLQTWDALAVVTGRFLLAVATLLPLWLLIDRPTLPVDRLLRGLAMGALAFGAGGWLIIIAQSLTDPVTVAIIAASSPIVATIIEWVIDRTPLRRTFMLGLVASVVGGVIATGGMAPTNLGLGALAAVGSCTLFAWGSLRSVRDFPDLSPLGRAALPLAGGALFIILTFALARSFGLVAVPPDIFTSRSFGLLAVYGLGAMAISQVLWIASVERLGVAIASFHTNIAPFYVMLILLAQGQAWSWPQAIGAGIVAMGVVLAQS